MKKASYIILLFLFVLQSCSIPFTTGSRGISSTPFVGSCSEALRGLATGYKTYDDKVAGAFKLRLKSEDGDEIIEQDAANFLLDAKGRAHPHVREFAEEYFSRSPEEIEKLNKKITEIHADNEMTFMVKDKITGLYTKVSKVPFRGFVPMPKSSYEKLTNSTEAFMVTFREILQKVYSEEHTAKNLTIDSLPEDLQKVFLDVLRSSIYYEPKLNKKAMKDYPFSAVVGFDFAIDDIMNPKPISYEANGSTPSGLSNNMLLKHALQTGDKELFEKVSKNMVQGNPFRSLKKTIESNAEAWTEQSDGISVVIGPGSGNAAHPDVASIAEFSGMPLVTPKDLYIDANRKVRLNIGKGEDNPKVTGVYSRADESFLIQSSKNNVPLRDPGFYEGTNKKLAEKYGIELEPHIGYKYTFDKKGNPNGLVFNEDGSPALMETVYQLGKDPTRPLEGQTDELIDALLDKNIYISNIGGRTLDDKRIFQIIADILAKRHLPEGAQGVGPTKTLGLSEMDELYNTPIKKLGKYVVKEPDGSGGKGVYILANEPESVRREVVEAVRNNPAYYTVQEFAEQSVVTTSNIDETGRIRLETTAMDARYYAMLDGENQLIVDPDAFLIRVASPLNGSTNTSKGAGYGMLYVVDDTGAVVKTIAKGESVLPVAPPRETIGITRQVQLDLFARQLSYLINATQEENVGNLSKLSVESLVALHRDTMDIFGLSFSPFIQQYRNYLDGKIELADFNAILVGLKKVIESGSAVPEPANSILNRSFRKNVDFGKSTQKFFTNDELAEHVTLQSLSKRAHSISMDHIVTGANQKEHLKMISSRDSLVQGVIDDLADFGGTVRHTSIFDENGKEMPSFYGQNYFRFDGNNRPIIGVNMTTPEALSSLAHEHKHFLDWKEAYEKFLAQGNSKARARKLAKDEVMGIKNVYNSEKRAVARELEVEEQIESAFNRVRDSFSSQKTSPRFINRVLYPGVEALKKQLIDNGGEVTPEIKNLVEETISAANYEKERMIKRLRLALRMNEKDSVARFEIEQKLEYLRKTSLFELIINDSAFANFTRLGYGDTIKELFAPVIKSDDRFYLRMDSLWQSSQQQ